MREQAVRLISRDNEEDRNAEEVYDEESANYIIEKAVARQKAASDAAEAEVERFNARLGEAKRLTREQVYKSLLGCADKKHIDAAIKDLKDVRAKKQADLEDMVKDVGVKREDSVVGKKNEGGLFAKYLRISLEKARAVLVGLFIGTYAAMGSDKIEEIRVPVNYSYNYRQNQDRKRTNTDHIEEQLMWEMTVARSGKEFEDTAQKYFKYQREKPFFPFGNLVGIINVS